MLTRIKTTMSKLTPQQYAICAAVFVLTSIAATLLAWWYIRRNAKERQHMLTETP